MRKLRQNRSSGRTDTDHTLFGSNGYVKATERWSCREAKVEVPEVSLFVVAIAENSHLGPHAVKLQMQRDVKIWAASMF
jgi:hypothetical protein